MILREDDFDGWGGKKGAAMLNVVSVCTCVRVYVCVCVRACV